MACRVRAMDVKDIDAVYAIEVKAYRTPWTYAILENCVSVGYDCRVLELEDSDPHMASYLICSYHEHTCHLLNLCVNPVYKRQGYGQLLLQHLIDSLVDTQVNTIELEVRPSNIPALCLYKKMGFQQFGIKRGYYHDEHEIEDAMVLKKYL